MSGIDTKRALGTGTAPLLFWLLVIGGLAGVTLIRFDDQRFILPLWFGSIVGVSIGQILALLRVRFGHFLAIGTTFTWILGPLGFVVIVALFDEARGAEIATLTLVPAVVCGYASLSERGGLVAFWFPAMLWMLVILDGPESKAVTVWSAAPFVAALGALFVAFLRARETRRVALWQTYSAIRLATPARRTVLRESPLRSLSQIAWTVLVGSGALVLAAWVAPHLWAKEHAAHQKTLAVPPAPLTAAVDPSTQLPCCPASSDHERVSEYLSILHAEETPTTATACVICTAEVAIETTTSWSYGGSPGAGLWGTIGSSDPWVSGSYDGSNSTSYVPEVGYVGGSGTSYTNGYAVGGYTAAGYTADGYAPHGDTSNAPPLLDTPPPVAHEPPAPAPVPVSVDETPTPATKTNPGPAPLVVDTPSAPPSVTSVTPAPPAPLSAPLPVATSPDAGPPWGWFVAIVPTVLVLHLAWRAARRRLTLRHLERPFWPESIDQQISNHWQRMLIGLRDAGVRSSRAEEPQAFARRIGMEGMAACATILERARHGVRIDADDLAAMAAAATTVYETSRRRAGLAGRVAATFRWPLV